MFEESEKRLHYLIEEVKCHCESNLIEQFAYSNNSRIFQCISSLKSQSTLPITMSFNDRHASNDQDKAELFNTYFFSVFTTTDSDIPSTENNFNVTSPLQLMISPYMRASAI